MPKLQMIDGGVKHYAYTPSGKKQYQQDKANQLGANKMQPSLTHKMPNGKMMSGKKHIDDYGLGTDGLKGFKSAKEEIAKRRKTKQRTRSKY